MRAGTCALVSTATSVSCPPRCVTDTWTVLMERMRRVVERRRDTSLVRVLSTRIACSIHFTSNVSISFGIVSYYSKYYYICSHWHYYCKSGIVIYNLILLTLAFIQTNLIAQMMTPFCVRFLRRVLLSLNLLTFMPCLTK